MASNDLSITCTKAQRLTAQPPPASTMSMSPNWPASVNKSRRFLMPHDAGKSLCGAARSFALQHRSALLHEHARAREPASPVPLLCKRLGLSLEWSFASSEEPCTVSLESATQEPRLAGIPFSVAWTRRHADYSSFLRAPDRVGAHCDFGAFAHAAHSVSAGAPSRLHLCAMNCFWTKSCAS
jgi:hypothetical protein